MTAVNHTVYAVDDEGKLVAMELSEAGLSAPQTLAELPRTSDEQSYSNCDGLAADENALWALLSENNMDTIYGKSTLYRIDRVSGEVCPVDIPSLTDVCGYREGALLARQWDPRAMDRRAPELVVIDPETLSATVLTALESESFAAPVYDGEKDLIYVASSSKLNSISPDLTQQAYAYLSLASNTEGQSALLWHGRYLIPSQDSPLGVNGYANDPSLMPKQVLRVDYPYMSKEVRVFCAEYPEIALELAVEAGSTPVYPASATVLFSNPYTKNRDAAIKYLTYMAEHLTAENNIALFPDQNESVEDEYYQEALKTKTDYLESVKERLSAADEENRKELEAELAEAEAAVERVESDRWRISTEDIERYRALVPNVLLLSDSILNEQNVLPVLDRYLEQQLTVDQCIDELERVLHLIRLENE